MRISARVEGRVQGVGFRAFVAAEARALGLDGWVRNTADGAVELVAEGDEAAIGALVEALGVGPPRSRVADVRVHRDAPPDGPGESGFSVRR
jgi:acylphosphatase